MMKKYFEEHVLKCKNCGSKPLLIEEVPFTSKSGQKKFRVICWECKWRDGEFGNKTGLCETPESALKIWNKKFGKIEE